MKKLLSLSVLAVLAMASVALTSCSKDDDDNNDDPTVVDTYGYSELAFEYQFSKEMQNDYNIVITTTDFEGKSENIAVSDTLKHTVTVKTTQKAGTSSVSVKTSLKDEAKVVGKTYSYLYAYMVAEKNVYDKNGGLSSTSSAAFLSAGSGALVAGTEPLTEEDIEKVAKQFSCDKTVTFTVADGKAQ